jgi:hypothetical protein
MAMKNLAAWTSTATVYPPFVSINKTPTGKVSLTVRAAASPDGACGRDATAEMSEDDFRLLLADAAARL